MNRDVESAECIHGMCEACTFEDCACLCHLPGEIETEAFEDPDDVTMREGGYC